LGPYEIVAPLGAGGMGEVYRALDSRLGRSVAIKILGEELIDNPKAEARFRKEARAIAALSHPNILAIHEFDVEANTPIVVTELLEGHSLRQRVAARLPWRKAVEIAAAVGEGLAAAHARGIIHRDLKPDNVFLTADGRVKILDFGIAHVREIATPSSVATSVDTPLLESHSAVGTLGYASPEQLRGFPAAPPTDIFSLGVILYELIAGKNPFLRRSTAETIAAVLDEEPPPLTDTEHRVPAAVDHFVRRCIEKDPAHRFQSAHDLVLRLRELLAESDAAIARTLLRKQSVAWGAVIAILVLVFSVVVSQRGRLGKTGPLTSVAVLPFANMTKDASFEYLSDGMSESLINEISELPSARVSAWPTVFRYKGRATDAARVGRDLGVRAIATGRIERQDNDFIVQASLVDASDGSQLWGARYTRQRADLVNVPNEIAREIATRLHLNPASADQQRLARAPTSNPIAYDLYLKGLHELRKENPADRPDAIAYFQQALEVDPRFARAYAALAETYLRSVNITEGALMKSKARDAVSRALAIDPELAEAHASLGFLHVFEWNFKSAELEFQRALRRNPSLLSAHIAYCHMLRANRRTEEALHQGLEAKQLDPLSRAPGVALANVYLAAHQADNAISELTRLLKMNANFHTGHYLLGRAYEEAGRPNDACSEYVRWLELSSGADSRHVDALRSACQAKDGKAALEGYYRERLRFLLGQQSAEPYEIASTYACLRQDDKIFDLLEKAYEQRSSAIINLYSDTDFDRFHSDPRFIKLIQKVGFTGSPGGAAGQQTGSAGRPASN